MLLSVRLQGARGASLEDVGQQELDRITSTYQQMCNDKEEESERAKGFKKKGSKPAWALSGEAAADIEEAEEEDLMSFVDSLDYDTYIKECDDKALKEAWRLMQVSTIHTRQREWGMRRREWKMRRREWKMRRREWKMRRREWGIRRREWRVHRWEPEKCKA
eukprot:1186899-Prorocentrum_minimum.AAC.1